MLHAKYREMLGEEWRIGVALFVTAAHALTVALLTDEVYSYWALREEQFRATFARQASISVLWAAYGMGLISLGFARRSAVLRSLGLALFAITVTKLFMVDLLALDGIYRIVGFLALGLVLLTASFLYHRSRRRIHTAPV